MPCLPAETLKSIFLYVIRNKQLQGPIIINEAAQNRVVSFSWSVPLPPACEPKWPGEEWGSLGWICLGHILHKWRSVLLSCPRFWAKDVRVLPLGFAECTQCSGQLLLVITMVESSICKNGVATLESALRSDLASRICKLHIIATQTYTQEIDNILQLYTLPSLC